MKLSIVTTMYHSAPYLNEFHRRVTDAARTIAEEFEIIFVNDGSPDDSLAIACDLADRDRRVKVIDLSRNFGHHKAIMTGLSHAKGEYVFLIDSDLEEDPAFLESFWNILHATADCDVVYGVQESRKGGWLERLSGAVFYRLYNIFSVVEVPTNVVTCRLMTRRYVRALVRHREQEIFLAGLWAASGFVQKSVTVRKLNNSPTTYTFRRKLAILINSITSFSNRPLIFIFNLGIVITFLASICIGYLLLRKLFHGVGVEGWASIVASIWFIGGLTIFSIGVIGIYLSKIFTETKRRPYTIIKGIYGDGSANE